MTKSRKDYEKELSIQTALGTLSRYRVCCPGAKNSPCKFFRLKTPKNNEWFISCEVTNAVNAEHAIDVVMTQYDFPKIAQKYLSAERM